ncbi:hypothetical protein [Haladaptatus sp. CMSO5]|uniref:hypothetical protein n=1 Tax=Haladaptatus sp. CMSO5 TaxID=3120514 RepID=UPI002FCDEF8C
MKLAEYYIKELNLSIEPNFQGLDYGGISIDFEVSDNPQYDSEVGKLIVEYSLECSLTCYSTPHYESNREDEEEIGNVDVEVVTTVNGDEEEFEDALQIWKEDGYTSVPWEFRYHLESGFLSEVLSPISSLVDNSFRGVIPSLTFTNPPKDEKLLDIDMDEWKRRFIKEFLEENIWEVIQENVEGDEIDGVSVELSENFSEAYIEFDWADEKGEIKVANGDILQEQIRAIFTTAFDKFFDEELHETPNLIFEAKESE